MLNNNFESPGSHIHLSVHLASVVDFVTNVIMVICYAFNNGTRFYAFAHVAINLKILATVDVIGAPMFYIGKPLNDERKEENMA